MNKFYQISYGKTEENMGWHCFNVEPGFPISLDFFRTFSNACAPGNFNSKSLTNSDNSVRDALAIFSFGGNYGQTWVRYGFKESISPRREYMIATGFLATIPNDNAWSPDEIISISKKNYKFIPSESFGFCSQLEYDDARSFSEVVTKLGLDEKSVLDILKVVYLSMFEERNSVTYLICDYDDDKVKDMAYLIYDLLPMELRGNIMVTNSDVFNSPVCKIFKIINEYPGTGAFYNVETKDCNIELERTTVFSEKFPFVAVFEKYGYSKYKDFCNKISEAVVSYGFKRSLSYTDLLFIFDLHAGVDGLKAYSDEKLDMFIEKLLFRKLPDNKKLNDYIIDALNLLYSRQIVPSESLIEAIEERAQLTGLAEYENIAVKFSMMRIVDGDERELFQYLDEKQSSSEFPLIIEFLVSANKKDIITAYFDKRISACSSVQSLESLTESLDKLGILKTVYNALISRLIKICNEEIKRNICSENSVDGIFNEAKSYFKRFFTGDFGVIENRIKKSFIDAFTPSSFVFDSVYVSNVRKITSGNASANIALSKLLDIFFAVCNYANNVEDQKSSRNRIHEALRAYLQMFPSDAAVVKKIYDFLVKKLSVPDNNSRIKRNEFDELVLFWFPVAFNIGKCLQVNMTQLLLDANLSAFTNDLDFEGFVLPKLKSLKNTTLYYQAFCDYLSYADPKSDNYKLIKKRAALLKSVIKKEESSKSKFGFRFNKK